MLTPPRASGERQRVGEFSEKGSCKGYNFFVNQKKRLPTRPLRGIASRPALYALNLNAKMFIVSDL
jgi:hypothetical protein